MAQLLVHLPDELAARFRRAVPPRYRSRLIQQLIEAALPAEADDPLYRTALAVERNDALNAGMAGGGDPRRRAGGARGLKRGGVRWVRTRRGVRLHC